MTPGAARAPEPTFFARQVRIATENSGRIDPESLEDYVEAGGYEALRHVLTTMTPAEVRDEITRSGLRGRGGAGYPTGLKWNTVAKAAGSPKYVICNADEGDPGAFMDRSVLESDPHRVLEGMAIAAYAVGASPGYVYCRAEYPLVVSRLRKAIREAARAGYLGASIMDTEFGFEVDVRLGAGAFVCGEETALIASIEGGRGTPTPRPPYPAVAGLWDQPTLINNVETFANVAPIIRNGGDWFADIGTATSKGTKVFALAGRVVNTGPRRGADGHDPARDRLRHRRRDRRRPRLQGRPDRRSVGRLHPGRVPRHAGRLRVAHRGRLVHGLRRHDRHGRHLLHGRRGEVLHGLLPRGVVRQVRPVPGRHDRSCGCCSIGSRAGEATMDDLAQMERLAAMVQRTSLCGLGQGAPNPIFSTLRYFRDEYLAHIVDRVCPAGVCAIEEAPVPA